MLMRKFINTTVQNSIMKKYMLFIVCFLFVLGNAHAINPYSAIGNGEFDWEQYGQDAIGGTWLGSCGGIESTKMNRLENVSFNVSLDSGVSMINYNTFSHYYAYYSYYRIYVDGVYLGIDTLAGSEGCKTGSFNSTITDTDIHNITFECISDLSNGYCGFARIYYDGSDISNPNYYRNRYDYDITGYSYTTSMDVAVADLDNDGDGDLVVNTGCFGDVQQNIGSITEPLWYANSDWDITVDGGCTSYSVGDLVDLDGDDDFDYCLAYGLNNGYVKCIENNGTVTNPSWNYRADWSILTPVTGSYYALSFGDINGDGLVDMFFNNRELAYNPRMYQNTGNSSYPIWTSNSTLLPPTSNKASNFIDLDYDGDLDFYAGYVYHENTGSNASPSWSADSTYNLPRGLIALGGGATSFDFGEVIRDTPYGNTDRDIVFGVRDLDTGNSILILENEFEAYPTAPCTPNISCTEWSSCFIEFGDRVKQRFCTDSVPCASPTVEKASCGLSTDVDGTGFYSPTAPDEFILYPQIIVPSTENNEPNINSQTITGFGCFTNWYGYGDSTLDRMEYTVNNITRVVYPNSSVEPCGKGLDCDKPYGYIQTWDYVDDYFTQYDNYDTEIILTCYGTDLSSSNLTIELNPKEEDYCYISNDGITKECFSFSDNMNNHIYSSTDLNLKPTSAFDLDRITTEENTPDWQMYRVSTDVINYFSDELHNNDAKDSFNKIAQKEGYQIIELFTSPQSEAQVYFDFFTEDIYPKYFSLTDSDGQIQILVMFYNNEVYYFDGYSFKSMGDYALNTPYTVEIDFDVPNQRFKLGLNTWHMYIDDSYTVYSWKKIGSWQYDSKIGTFVSQFGDLKDIKYLAITMMSELCNSDSDCSSTVGSQSYYGGSTTTTPAFNDDWGFKQIKEHLYSTDGSFLRYFDDEQSSNTGVSTINSWSGLSSGIFNVDSTISFVWKSEEEGFFCFGDINKTIDIYTREGTDSWTSQENITINTTTNPQTYSLESDISFDQVKFDFKINGGVCIGSSRGSIDIDSIRATNKTNSSGGECRDIDWFAETFTNTSGNLEWAFNKSMNNSLFMLEWDDEIYTNLKLDTDVWYGGYCYSDMILDNIETFNTRGTFQSSEEDLKSQTFNYEWLEKLGWNLDGNQAEITGDTDGYVSNYYNWDVCTDEGREYNRGVWCIINVNAQVLWDIALSSIYGNFSTFLIFLFLLMVLSTFAIMFNN